MPVGRHCLAVLGVLTLLLPAFAAPESAGAARSCPKRHVKGDKRPRKLRPHRGLRRIRPGCHAAARPAVAPFKHRRAKEKPKVTHGGFGREPEHEVEHEDEEEGFRSPPGPLVRNRPEPKLDAPALEEAPGTEIEAETSAARMLLTTNRDLKAADQPVWKSIKPGDGEEQSVASNGKGIVLFTANTFGAFSKDGGRSFTNLDPSAVLGHSAGGVCCDQVVLYIPSQDRFIWLVQYWAGKDDVMDDTRTNAIRLATATSDELKDSNGRRWTQYVFTPSDFGAQGGFELDRPEPAFSARHLYFSVASFTKEDRVAEIIVRIPLAQLGRSINYPYFWTDRGGHIKPAQNGAGQASSPFQYFAQNVSTTKIRVFEAHDGTNHVRVYEVDVPAIGTRNFRSLTPGGANWMQRTAAKMSGQVLTGARVGDVIWFGWVAGRTAHIEYKSGKIKEYPVHDQPAVEVVGLDFFSLRRVATDSIEFGDAATNLPKLAGGAGGDLAVSFMWGGDDKYPNHAVGFLRPTWDSLTTIRGNIGYQAIADLPSGDYTGIGWDPVQRNCFFAAGAAPKERVYGTNQTANYVDPHYIHFGRAEAKCKLPPRINPVIVPPIIVPTVVPTATPAPTQTPRPLADLIINSFTSTSVTVSNIGTAAAGAFTVHVTRGEDPTLRFGVGGLDPNTTATFNFSCLTGTSTATADASTTVTESNEANNTAVRTFECEARSALDAALPYW